MAVAVSTLISTQREDSQKSSDMSASSSLTKWMFLDVFTGNQWETAAMVTNSCLLSPCSPSPPLTLAWSSGNEMQPCGQPLQFSAMGEVEVRLRCLGLDLWSKTCAKEAGVRPWIHLGLLVVTLATSLWANAAFHCSAASLPRVTCDASLPRGPVLKAKSAWRAALTAGTC